MSGLRIKRIIAESDAMMNEIRNHLIYKVNLPSLSITYTKSQLGKTTVFGSSFIGYQFFIHINEWRE